MSKRKAKFKRGQVVVMLYTARNPYRRVASISQHELGYWQYDFTNGERESELGLRPLTRKERGDA